MKFSTLAIAMMFTLSVNANAASIQAPSSTFAGTVIDFNDFDGYILPQIEGGSLITSLNLGSGVTLTTTPFSVVGQNAFDLDQNGLWTVIGNSNRDGNFISTSFLLNNGAINFSFDTPMQKVGIFANQSQSIGNNNSLQVLAYDINGNVLETFTVSIDTDVDSYDEGKFIGFERSTADIYGFSLANGSFVVDNLTITAIPEPETYAMFLAGLGFMGIAARRRKAS
jgi:PEP-CTERM motif